MHRGARLPEFSLIHRFENHARLRTAIQNVLIALRHIETLHVALPGHRFLILVVPDLIRSQNAPVCRGRGSGIGRRGCTARPFLHLRAVQQIQSLLIAVGIGQMNHAVGKDKRLNHLLPTLKIVQHMFVVGSLLAASR